MGLSQEKLAERAGLHRTYICDIENGARNVSLENIDKLARALGISVPTLFLPPESKEPQPKKPASNRGKAIVDILLVEDNADDVELTLHAFEESRFTNHVHVARDGAEALDFLFCEGDHAQRPPAQSPQLILLDLNLPKISGLEVLRRIKADKRTRTIPVVVLTLSQRNTDISECRRLGAETYIVKPLDFQRLSQATPRLNLDWVLLNPTTELSMHRNQATVRIGEDA